MSDESPRPHSLGPSRARSPDEGISKTVMAISFPSSFVLRLGTGST